MSIEPVFEAGQKVNAKVDGGTCLSPRRLNKVNKTNWIVEEPLFQGDRIEGWPSEEEAE